MLLFRLTILSVGLADAHNAWEKNMRLIIIITSLFFATGAAHADLATPVPAEVENALSSTIDQIKMARVTEYEAYSRLMAATDAATEARKNLHEAQEEQAAALEAATDGTLSTTNRLVELTAAVKALEAAEAAVTTTAAAQARATSAFNRAAGASNVQRDNLLEKVAKMIENAATENTAALAAKDAEIAAKNATIAGQVADMATFQTLARTFGTMYIKICNNGVAAADGDDCAGVVGLDLRPLAKQILTDQGATIDADDLLTIFDTK